MKVWLEEDEESAEAFRVELRGGELPGRRKLAQALHESSLLGKAEVSSHKQGSVRSAAAHGKQGSLLVVLGEEGGFVSAHAWADPALLVRSVEALFLRLQPAEVRLGTAGKWRPYPPEGALFVRTIHSEQSDFQQIAVGEHPVYGRLLFLNGETQIGTSDEPEYSAALASAGLGKNTKRVCILGGGDCGVLREVLGHEGVEEVVMIEIDRRVVETARSFFPGVVGGGPEDARARIVYRDANDFLTEEGARIASGEAKGFDLIVYDLSDAPLAKASLDALCGRVKACLAPKGRIAVQCGSALPMYTRQLKAHRAGLERHFRKLKLRELVIPSFLEQPWVFASARA